MKSPSISLVMLTAMAAMALAEPYSAYGLTEEEAMLEAAMPSENNMESMKQQIAANPGNLDHYFNYAMLAKNLKNYDEAAWALENMLNRKGDLQRVKLELALIYMEVERFDQARELFTEVLQSNPPEQVRSNVSKILAALDKRSQKHHLKTTLLAGANNDSNSNSAPGSGNVTVVDTTIPLGNGSGAREDLHYFGAISANHTYDIINSRKQPSWRWKSTALAYHTEQTTLENLNIGLYSLKTGPEITLNEIPLQASATVGYQHISLDNQSYLRNPKLEGELNYLLQPDLILNYGYMWEYRDYMNSDTNTTFRNRNGNAFQHKLGMRHVLTPKDMLAYYVLLRNETSRELYLANDQAALNVTYTRALTEQAFMSLTGGYRVSSYVIPDLLISTRNREDDEFSGGITLGYRLESSYYGDFIISGGYQYRDVGSTIQNYEYDNHRFSVSVAKEFEY